MKRSVFIAMLCLLGIFSQCFPLYALSSTLERQSIVTTERSESYELGVASKLQRGFENFFMGWLEIPHGVKAEHQYRKEQYLEGGFEPFFLGLYRGTMNGIGRTAVGFYEGVTCLYPQEPILEDMSEWLY